MKQIERQDIKLVIDRLDDVIPYCDNPCTIESAISLLEDLGNAYHALQLENAKLKQEILQLEAMIED